MYSKISGGLFMSFKSIYLKLSEKKKLKSVVTFFLLFLLMIVLPCTIITFYANKLITQKLQMNNENYLSSASLTLDNIFQACNTQAKTILQNTSEDFYTLLNSEDLSSQKTSLASYRFQTTIKNTYFNPDFFIDAFIYFENPDIIFTTQGTYDSDTFFQQHRMFKSYSQNFFTELMDSSYNNIFCPPTDIFTQTLTEAPVFYSHAIPVAINLTGPAPSDAVLVLLLDEEKLNTALGQMNTAKTSYFYILDTRSDLILNHPAEVEYDSLLELHKLPYDTNKGIQQISHSSDYRILWQKSGVNRLTYICVEPNLLITKQLQSFLWLTLSIVFIALIFFAVIYHLFSTHMHTTLLAVFDHLKQTADDSCFSYADPKSIDMSVIVNAAELLHQQHDNNRPQLIQAFLLHLFHDNANPAEIDSFCKRFQIFPKGDCFQIISLQTNFYIWEDSYPSTEYHTIIKDLKAQAALYGHIISLNNNCSFSILLTASDANELNLKAEQLINLLKTGTENCIPESVCAESSIFYNIADAYLQYHKTLNLLETRGISNQQFLYSPKDIATTPSAALLPETKNKIRSLAEHHPEECPQYIQYLIDNFSQQNITFTQYRTITLELLFLLQEILYEYTIPFSAVSFIDESELLPLSEKIITTERLNAMCLTLYTSLARQLIDKHQNNEPAEMLILNYIDEHLTEISLTLLSDAMSMNPNYLSQYFKKHFGISFTDYVSKKKIEKAKKMLIHTTLTCKSIGEELGYHDPNVFTRAFKKLESITPNEYRRSHKLTSL